MTIRTDSCLSAGCFTIFAKGIMAPAAEETANPGPFGSAPARGCGKQNDDRRDSDLAWFHKLTSRVILACIRARGPGIVQRLGCEGENFGWCGRAGHP